MKKLKLIFIFFLFCTPIYIGAQENSKDNNAVTFYVTRHGKTMLNTLVQAQGWADSPLTPPGVEVAEFLGKGLKVKNVKFKSAYSSDLGRARQTARIVLETSDQSNIKVNEVENLRECCFGSYEGKPDSKMWGDVAIRLGYRKMEDFFNLMKEEGTPAVIKGLQALQDLDELGMAENYYEVKERSQLALKEAASGGGNVLVVVHGVLINILLSDLDSTGKIIPQSPIGNASVSKVTYKDGKFYIESYGDMDYIEKGKASSNK